MPAVVPKRHLPVPAVLRVLMSVLAWAKQRQCEYKSALVAVHSCVRVHPPPKSASVSEPLRPAENMYSWMTSFGLYRQLERRRL